MGVQAFVFRYPGLYVVEESTEAALHALPEAVRAEWRWLAERGVPIPPDAEPVEIWEIERIDLGSDVSRGRWVGAFRYERRPTTDADVALALERTALVRIALRELLERGVGGASAVADGLAERAGEVRTLLSRLGTRPEGDPPGDPRERWEAAGRLAEERLRNLLPGDRERHAVFEGEEWTTRKVLRVLATGERALYARVASLHGVRAPASFGGSAVRLHSPR